MRQADHCPGSPARYRQKWVWKSGGKVSGTATTVMCNLAPLPPRTHTHTCSRPAHCLLKCTELPLQGSYIRVKNHWMNGRECDAVSVGRICFHRATLSEDVAVAWTITSMNTISVLSVLGVPVVVWFSLTALRFLEEHRQCSRDVIWLLFLASLSRGIV